MKLGFCLHKEWTLTQPELLGRLSALAYDGVEVWAQAFEAGGLDEVRAALEPHGLSVISVNPYFDFTTSEASYAWSLEEADRYVAYARALGCTRIRTFTSRMKSFGSSEQAEPIHWERAVNGIREVCDRAAPHGIDCVMEVHHGDGQLCDTSEATQRILEAVDRANLTVNLQPPLRGEDPLESAERLGRHVTHLHANAWKGEWGNFTFLEDGDVDFAAFLRVLHRHGFDGFVSIEHATKDPIGFAEHNAVYLRSLFDDIEANG